MRKMEEIREALTQARKDAKIAQLVVTRYIPRERVQDQAHATTGESLLHSGRTITVEW